MNSILQYSILGNTVKDYAIVAALLLGGILVLAILRKIVISRLKKFAARTETTLDDIIIQLVEKMVVPLLYVGLLYFSLRTLQLHEQVLRGINIAGIFLLTFIGVKSITTLLEYMIRQAVVNREETGREERERKVRGLLPALKIMVWGLGLVFLLDNLGFKISTVIAGLGIGGVAVALAAQAVLGDLFSYFSVLFDQPFEVGDFIIVGDHMGVVEYIGIKTTRLRSLSGEQLIFSNSDLTGSRIRNYKRMQQRRVLFTIGVTYDTPLEKLKAIPGTIQSIIQSQDDTVFDRSHFASLAILR